MRLAAWAMCFVPALGGCGDGGGRACVTIDPSCTPLYAPTFDNIYENTLHKTCAQTAVCHSREGAMGGLVYEDPDEAYRLLLGQMAPKVGDAKVLPGDAACSELVERIESANVSFQMPPGKPLLAAERCAIEQWIAAGAKR